MNIDLNSNAYRCVTAVILTGILVLTALPARSGDFQPLQEKETYQFVVRWDFVEDSDFLGWETFNVVSPVVKSGLLSGKAENSDPVLRFITKYGAEARHIGGVAFRVRASQTTKCQVYLGVQGTQRMLVHLGNYTLMSPNEFETIVAPLTEEILPSYIVDTVRVDPVTTTGIQFDVDWIGLIAPSAPTPTSTPIPQKTPTPESPTATPVIVRPTPTPTSTATPTPTFTPTPTLTPTPTETKAPDISPRPTPTEEVRETPTPTDTATAVPTSTPRPEPSPTVPVVRETPTPTAEPLPPTPTDTAIPTSIPTPVPTDTPLPTPEPTAIPTDTPVPTLPASPTPAASPAWMVLSQGYGGSTANKVMQSEDMQFIASFSAMPKPFAEFLKSPRERSVNAAVADIDGDGAQDVVTAFGPGGMGSSHPSVLVVWTPPEKRLGKLRVVGSRGVFDAQALNPLLRNPHGALNVAAGRFVEDETLPMIVAAQGLGGDNQIRLLQFVDVGEFGKLEIVGTFQGLTGAAVRGNSSGGTSVAAGDLDQDGLDELIVGQMNGKGATTLFQILDLTKADGRIQVAKRSVPIPAMPDGFRGLGGVNLAIGDVDGNGDNEIITACAGMPDGALGNAAFKNFVRVFDVELDSKQRISTVNAMTSPVLLLGANRNPSGGLSIAAGNLDQDSADELLIGTQAVIALDTSSGTVKYSEEAPAPLVKGVEFLFAKDGTFIKTADVIPPFKAFAGVFAPTSGAVNVQAYPWKIPPVPFPTPSISPTITPTSTPTNTPTNTPTPTIYIPPKLGWIPFSEGAEPTDVPDIIMKDETTTGLLINFDVPGMFAREVEREGVMYHRLSIPGHAALTKYGEPELPIIGKIVEVPFGVDFDIDIFKSESIYLNNYNVYPAQPPEVDKEPELDAPFQLSEEVYAGEAYYPGQLAGFEAEDIGIVRGHRILFLKVKPVQYNPSTKMIEAFSNIEVRIEYSEPAQLERVDSRIGSPEFEKVLEASILNHKDLVRFPRPVVTPSPGEGQSRTGCDYLILTHPDFYQPKDPNNPLVRFRDWKQRKGYVTKIVDVTTLPLGNTSASIQDYIQDAYDDWDIVPTYVLLVGDSEFIPTTYGTVHTYPHYPAGTQVATDLYYTTVHGTDYFPDIFLGRLSVDTLAETEDVIDKILDYERNPSNVADYYNNVSLVALFEDDTDLPLPDPAPEDGDEDRIWIESAEEIRTHLLNKGYGVERIYATSSGFPGDPTSSIPQTYQDGTALPADLQNANGFAWDGDTDDVEDAINEGRFLINYRDHGGRGGWSHPAFANGDVDGLTNGLRMPVIFSIACENGWFDNETDAAGLGTLANSESVCEHFLRHGNGGAIAIIGATRVSWTGHNDFLMFGLNKAIWPDFIPNPPLTGFPAIPDMLQPRLLKMGPIHTFGKVYMANAYSHNTRRQIQFEMYHLFGDPEMPIWTEKPRALKVEHPIGIGALAEQDFIVKVTEDTSGDPLLSAKVVLTQGDILLAVQETDPFGIARFTFVPAATDIDITVTKHNYLPYEGSIDVSALGAGLNRLSPEHGIEGQNILVGGQNFLGEEQVDIYFGDTLVKSVNAVAGSFGQAGVADVWVEVPSPHAHGLVNLFARGKDSGRYAVDVFRVRSENPIDLYTYNQYDESTWHLHAGGNPTWNNPEIKLYDDAGNQVQSDNLITGVDYTIRAKIHNDTDFDADNVRVVFKWANYGVGQSDRVWTDMEDDPILLDVPAHTVKEASVVWAPPSTGHLCLRAYIHHVEDINEENNFGQENCNVSPTSSPVKIQFYAWNPTDKAAAIHFEVRQLGDRQEGGTGPLWTTRIQHPDPQVIPPDEKVPVWIEIDPDPADVTKGQEAEFAVTGFIGGQMIGGINVIVYKE